MASTSSNATDQAGWKAVDVFVSYRCGAYVTNTVMGRKASSTVGPEFAARKLADKLFGANGGVIVQETSEGTTFTRRYRCSGWLGGKVQDGPAEPSQEAAPVQVGYGPGTGKFGPGVSITLTGDDVATAIDAWLVARGVHVSGPRTVTVNGGLCASAEVYVDPCGSVVAGGRRFSGRGG